MIVMILKKIIFGIATVIDTEVMKKVGFARCIVSLDW